MKFIIVVLVVIFAAILQHILKLVYFLGYHKTVFNHQPGSCHLVEGVDYGSEDLQTLHDEGLVFITSGMKLFSSQETNPDVKGKIFLFNFANPLKKAVDLELKNFDKETFNPHGISVFKNKTSGVVSVFVVNHHPEEERIEKFQFNYGEHSLTHIRSYTDPSFTMLNDVLATSEETFYTTVYARFKDLFLRNFEIYFMLKLGSVAYYDGEKATTFISGLFLPNGINWSPDEKFVYVADTTPFDDGFNVYKRNKDMSLDLHQRIVVGTSQDNLEVLPNGEIWTGCHPRITEISEMLHNRSKSASSQVLRISMNDGNMTAINEVYANDRNGILHGSTVATYYKKKMLVGTVHHKLLYCDIDIPMN